jgi:ligand-binding sensor domain-containing protein/signal transduction histidine kinase
VSSKSLLFYLLCGLVGLPGIVRSQTKLPADIHFEHYTPLEGLSSGQVRSILQDSFGFIWIGTPDGLNRFDGKQFDIYRHKAEDSNSITNNIVNALALDARGRVWVATNKGLCFFDYADGLFHPVDMVRNNGEQFDRYRVYAVVAGLGNRVWYSTITELHVLGPDGRVSSFPLPADAQGNISCLTEDDRGRIWVGTNAGLVLVFDSSLRTFTQVALYTNPRQTGPAPGPSVCHIYQQSSDSFLVCTWSRGLQRISCSNGHFIASLCPDDRESNDHKWVVPTVCPSVFAHQLWVATYGSGLSLYDPASHTFTHHLHHTGRDESSLCSEFVNTVFTDNAGILWVGTDDGLDKYDTLVNRFSILRITALPGRKQAPAHVVDLLTDRRDSSHNKIWLAVSGVGLVDYRLGSGVRHIYSHPGDPADKSINCLYQDSSGILWLGEKQGLIRFDSHSGKFTRLAGENSALSPHSISMILEDRKKRIWVGTYNNGVYCYTISSGKWAVYRHARNLPGSLPDDHVFVLTEDADGRIWVGTQNQGLCMLDNEEGRWHQFRTEENNIYSLPDNNVYALQEDKVKGRLWIATENGLAVMNLRDFGLHTLSSADGLCNNDVFAIAMTADRHLWLATNNGISDFDPDSVKFRNYYMRDGLPKNSFDEAFHCLPNGNMLLGFPGGLVLFNAAAMRTNKRMPEVVITACKVFDKNYPLSIHERRPDPLLLSYRQNMITFEFAALNFTHPKNNKYAYWLEGFDKDWIYCSDRSSATYTNLDGGNYVFHVKASNNDGIWNEKGAALSLRVKPPFRKTWEFYMLMLVVVFSALYILHRYRVMQVLQIQQVRADIARDLHDDIGSTLSSIFMMSRMGLKEDRKTQLQKRPAELLGTISRASQQAMELMSDIVWSVNPANDGMEQVLIRMREYAGEMLDASDIRLRFEAGPNVGQVCLSLKRRKELLLIFKEAVNNLAKHSGASDALIKISYRANLVELLVEDNGVGLETGKKGGGNGLKNMAERAARIRASLFFDRGPSGGTIVRLTLPLDSPAGGDFLKRANGDIS